MVLTFPSKVAEDVNQGSNLPSEALTVGSKY